MPKINVLMSVYNETPTQLHAAIDSILAQTEADFTMNIVLDQPAADDLHAILDDYAASDPRVQVQVNAQNSGLPFSLNRSVAAGDAPFLARMDADDIAVPTRFARQLAIMDERQLDVLSSSADFIDEEGQPAGQHDYIPEDPDALKRLLPLGSPLVHPSIMMRRAVLEAAGGYRMLPTAEDYDLWLRLLQAGARIGATNEKLMHYRLRGNSMTAGDRYKVFLVSEYLQHTYASGQFPDADSEVAQLQAYLKQNNQDDAQRRSQFTQRVLNLSAGKKALKGGNPFKAAALVLPALMDGAVRRYAKQSRAYGSVYAQLASKQEA